MSKWSTINLRTHHFRAAVNSMDGLTTSESERLSLLTPEIRSHKRTLVMVAAGRSADPDRDCANIGHHLHIWIHDEEKARRTLIG